MNNLIEKQLKKCTVANIPNHNDNATVIFIPKYVDKGIKQGKYYLIEVDDDLLVKGLNPMLEYNWNNGMVVPYKFLKVDVIELDSLMARVESIGYDNEEKKDLDTTWGGWLPISKIKVVGEL